MAENHDVSVEADRDICIGSGNCALSAPGVFALGDDGKVTVLKRELDDDDLDEVEEAVDLCPVRALMLAGGERGAP